MPSVSYFAKRAAWAALALPLVRTDDVLPDFTCSEAEEQPGDSAVSFAQIRATMLTRGPHKQQHKVPSENPVEPALTTEPKPESKSQADTAHRSPKGHAGRLVGVPAARTKPHPEEDSAFETTVPPTVTVPPTAAPEEEEEVEAEEEGEEAEEEEEEALPGRGWVRPTIVGEQPEIATERSEAEEGNEESGGVEGADWEPHVEPFKEPDTQEEGEWHWSDAAINPADPLGPWASIPVPVIVQPVATGTIACADCRDLRDCPQCTFDPPATTTTPLPTTTATTTRKLVPVPVPVPVPTPVPVLKPVPNPVPVPTPVPVPVPVPMQVPFRVAQAATAPTTAPTAAPAAAPTASSTPTTTSLPESAPVPAPAVHLPEARTTFAPREVGEFTTTSLPESGDDGALAGALAGATAADGALAGYAALAADGGSDTNATDPSSLRAATAKALRLRRALLDGLH